MNDDVNSEPRHPGKRLAAILDMVGMTRKELSLRTGVSEKYIEMVIHGAKDISFTFARRLEYAVGLSMQQWIDMQAQYDEYRFEQKARAGIHPDELEIPLHLVDVMPHLKRYRLLHEPKSDDDAILSLRKFMGVGDLRVVPDITHAALFRARHKGTGDIDPYVFHAWRQMCVRLTENARTAPVMDIQKLGDSLPAIKHLMVYEEEEIPMHLEKTFAACGIAFRLVPPFEGVPVRGFVRRMADGRGMLCLIARRERQDIFWRELFREISQIVNGNSNFIDFFYKKTTETYIDNFTDEVLVPQKRYERLVKNGNFSFDIVRRFAESQIVAEHIVLARLLRDGLIEETDEVRAHLPEYGWETI